MQYFSESRQIQLNCENMHLKRQLGPKNMKNMLKYAVMSKISANKSMLEF